MTTTATPPFAPSMLSGSWCVEQGNGNVGFWNPQFQLYADLGLLQYYDATLTPPAVHTINAAALAFKTNTDLWVVDNGNNVYRWQQPAQGTNDPANGWTQLSQLGQVKMVTFDNTGALYGVKSDADGTVVTWPTGGYSWTTAMQNTDDWIIDMVAFDNNGVMYCVAADPAAGTRVGVWNTQYLRWSSLGELGDRVLTMIAFDAQNNLWGVDQGGGIAYWDQKASPEQWVEPASDPTMLGLPQMAWLTWQPAASH